MISYRKSFLSLHYPPQYSFSSTYQINCYHINRLHRKHIPWTLLKQLPQIRSQRLHEYLRLLLTLLQRDQLREAHDRLAGCGLLALHGLVLGL